MHVPLFATDSGDIRVQVRLVLPEVQMAPRVAAVVMDMDAYSLALLAGWQGRRAEVAQVKVQFVFLSHEFDLGDFPVGS
jgi:hypothetical protein